MTTDPQDRDERVMTLADEALKIPHSERNNFLKISCIDDPELYREISEVVAWEERMTGFLCRPLIEFIDLEVLDKVFEPGQTVSGRFDILRLVGDGGMGVVYEAFDRKREQRIAIKVAKPGFGRLLTPELQRALQVRHENICMVNEVHTAMTEFGELDFLTMEFLDGETLARKLKQSKLERAEALEIARQLCAGVVKAHQSGILHGDLTPANVILCPRKNGSPRVVITDFGLSTETAGAGEIKGGTPSYMAPDLWRGGKASQASDVFSLGVILNELITGEKPFSATAEGGATVDSSVELKRAKNLPQRWRKAIMPCFRPKPEERCSAEQVLHELERKSFFRTSAGAVTIAAVIALAALAPWIVDAFRSPPIRLAMLPVQGSGGLDQRGRQILDEVAERVRQIQNGKATAAVIPLSKALDKGATTPEEAQKILGATHALQLKLSPETGGLAVEAAVIDLNTMTHVRDYSGHFAEADLSDLSTGLTGLISWGLHLRRRSQPESVIPSAVTVYKSGRDYLDHEPPDFINAQREFEVAEHLDSHSPLPLAGLAEAQIRKYQDAKDKTIQKTAQSWLAKAEALNPDSLRVRLTSGLLHLIDGDYPTALEDYQRVEEIEPRNVEALLGSGFAYETQGKFDRAIADYRRAISIDPKNYKPHEYLGALYYNRGNYAQSEEEFQKDIELAPDRIDAYGSLIGIYTTAFKYEDAEKVYKSLLQRQKQGEDTALMLNNIGVMLAYQGKQKEARDYYQRAVQKDPNRAKYWLNLGDAQRRIGEAANAKDSYQHGLRLIQDQVTKNVANALARARLAYFEARLGHKDEARLQITAAMNYPSKDKEVLLCAVETYEALGDREKALEAAAMATVQTQDEMAHHPDLAGLQQDSRFKSLRGQR
ncbi:MAG TPA: protein kinase [Candidatus Angelobacter sp.]|jgi:tetratricopeptide (TPR) repeat protein|nr:protein kinase [Candidatus Angelobacter sp.]